MDLSVENWIAIAAVAVALFVGVGGWIFLRQKNVEGTNQKQSVKGGTAIQSGGDTKIGGK